MRKGHVPVTLKTKEPIPARVQCRNGGWYASFQYQSDRVLLPVLFEDAWNFNLEVGRLVWIQVIQGKVVVVKSDQGKKYKTLKGSRESNAHVHTRK